MAKITFSMVAHEYPGGTEMTRRLGTVELENGEAVDIHLHQSERRIRLDMRSPFDVKGEREYWGRFTIHFAELVERFYREYSGRRVDLKLGEPRD